MAGYFRTVAERAFSQSPVLHAALRPADPRSSASVMTDDVIGTDFVSVGRHPQFLSATGSGDDLLEHDRRSRGSVIPERDTTIGVPPSVGDGVPRPRSPKPLRSTEAPAGSSPEKAPNPPVLTAPQRITPPTGQSAPLPMDVAGAVQVRARTAPAGPPRNEATAGVRPAFKDSAAAAAKAVRSGPAQTPPDVHIHIGRIELTAVTAPSSATKTPRSRTPMSLDEYLERRSRKPR